MKNINEQKNPKYIEKTKANLSCLLFTGIPYPILKLSPVFKDFFIIKHTIKIKTETGKSIANRPKYAGNPKPIAKRLKKIHAIKA